MSPTVSLRRRHRRIAAGLLLTGLSVALFACASIWGFDDFQAEPGGSEGGLDAGVDANREDTGPCGYDKPFQNVKRLDLGAAVANFGAWLTESELKIYFASKRDDASTVDLFRATRTDRGRSFSDVQKLACCNTSRHEHAVSVTKDERTLVFGRQGDLGNAAYELFIARKVGLLDEFDVQPLPMASQDKHEWFPFLTPDGGELWFGSNRAAEKSDIYMATGPAYSNYHPVAAPLNQPDADNDNPVLSGDEKTIYFGSSRGSTRIHVWAAQRDTVGDDRTWGEPVKVLVPGQHEDGEERPLWISPDECRLYFYSSRLGNIDRYIYMAERGLP